MSTENIKEVVKEKYGEAARRVSAGTACCASAVVRGRMLRSDHQQLVRQQSNRPDSRGSGASLAGMWKSYGAGTVERGETVLDLGSGGGIDVLLSAKRVGPTGKAYGLDMTDEMLALAQENQRKAGVENVEFLKGEIENIPLPDNSVDVIISNCVINLSADKDRVLREAFRVLKPGGRFAVSDVVLPRRGPAEVRDSVLLWVGCIAGALQIRNIKQSWRRQVSKRSRSSRRGSTASKTPATS